ncbi:hypothetical protein [Mycobacterium sp.]|uniref:hypothetical protein n=1 Tax=Mycobacterium sp. TaxID=1785 RepID=UPI0031D49C99
MVVTGIQAGKVAYERIYRDQASLPAQIGLLDDATLPITGTAQAQKVLDQQLPANIVPQR